MTPAGSFRHKIKHSLRIDRAFLFIWRASPAGTVIIFGLTAIQGLMPLLALWVIKLIIDSVTHTIQSGGTQGGMQEAAYLILLVGAIALAQAALRYLLEYVSQKQSMVVADYASDRIQKKSVDMDLGYYENSKYYDTLHRAQQEGLYRPNQIVNGLVRLVQNSVSLSAMVGLLFLLHWSIGLMLFVSTLPGLLVQIIYARKQFRLQQEWTPRERKAAYFNMILTSDMFAKEVRLFDLGSHFRSGFNTLRSSLRGQRLDLTRARGIAELCGQAFAIMILMGSLALILYRALSGAISIGDMVMFFQAFQRGTEYLKGVLSSVARLYEDNLFVEHFFEFLDLENQVVDPVHPRSFQDSRAASIVVENVTFKYPGERKPVLRDVSLAIEPGEIVALVGPNGAGKSSLVKLLCRLYDPQQGRISLSGIPLKDIKLEELRKQISAVFQDYSRYFLTVRENIGLGDISRPMEFPEIQSAARQGGAHDFIMDLPAAYETVLGRWFDSGEELSLGEWQKIVLSRAFFRDGGLIILDEPTSSLDVDSEFHLYTKFKELTQGRSALIISHRFSTIRMADTIYVLDEGRIAEHGSHRQLLDRGGLYSEAYAKQQSWQPGLSDKP